LVTFIPKFNIESLNLIIVMKRVSLASVCLLLLATGFTQSCPLNIDFESGNFSNWECFSGKTSVNGMGENVIVLNPTAPIAGVHEIITANSSAKKDQFGGFPTLCPYGGNYSVKLGNTNTGAEAEGLSYTFVVPSNVDTFTFTYFYAVVFEDPDHATEEQPRFFVTAYDVLTGNVINCASYNYVASAAIPGFKTSLKDRTVRYKDWSPSSIQFAGLANRQVRLEFKNADCTLGGHFGYAYLDVGTGCENILATAPYCIETNSIILNAPYGFQTYTWYSANFSSVIGFGQSITLSPPPDTAGTFYVDLIPYPGFGCRDTAGAVIKPLPVPDTPKGQPFIDICQFDTEPALTITPARGLDLVWYTTPSGGVGDAETPIIATNIPGPFVYYVSQKVLYGCESFRRKVEGFVTPTPTADFSINADKQCQVGNKFVFTNTSVNYSTTPSFLWDFGDGNSSKDSAFAAHIYAGSNEFVVKLRVENSKNCFKEVIKPINIIPKPVAAFDYPLVICENQTNVILLDRSSVSSNISAISNWWWTIDNQTYTGQQIPAFIARKPGNLKVELFVTTGEGCRSDTLRRNIPVYTQPTAFFNIEGKLCNNEIIQLKDASYFKTAANQQIINKWTWQINNNFAITSQNSALVLPAQLHSVRLTVETNFGCQHSFDNSFVVHPKPQIGMAINDSCVFRDIIYRAIDHSSSVSKWFWNFNNNWVQGAGLLTKRFTKEGPNSFSIFGETAQGCRDTIVRPFTIFDNKAFAPRDTLAAIGQPVLLISNGGPNVTYAWTPALGLDSPSVENPLAILDKDQLYRLYAITDKGCDSRSSVLVKRFKGPELFIADAFTPNRDQLNDQLKVFPVGIKTFLSFSIYNRYGQRVFFTNNHLLGWDGKVNGQMAPAGNYLAVALAVDYKGNSLKNAKNVILIR